MSSKNTIKKKQITRDCWSLDTAWYKWLRERLPVYLRDAGRVVVLDEIYFKDTEYECTLRQAVERMIFLLNEMQDLDSFWIERYQQDAQELRNLWAVWAPVLWW